MEIEYKERDNYPYDAIAFFEDYDSILNDERDGYGFKTATLGTFSSLNKYKKGLGEEVYNKYLKSRKQIKEFIDGGGKL